jgi:3-dehydroquinate synthase
MIDRTVHVNVTPPYPIHIGADLPSEIARDIHGPTVLIDDTNTRVAMGQALADALAASGAAPLHLTVNPGEGSKSVATWQTLIRGMAQANVTRDATVIAVGGGVVGDLAGFAAASYARGLNFVQVPTSLLAMADAAVGGKTGINLPEGKNLVGAFWQPSRVYLDVATLKTLPLTTFNEGRVEIVKHGLLGDETLLHMALSGDFNQDADDDVLVDVLERSVRVKARVVAEDALEQGGARATLNLGHTLAHAYEAISEHAIGHGVAVAWGLLYAAHLSAAWASDQREAYDSWTVHAHELIKRIDAPLPPSADFDALLPYLARDKKNDGRGRRWVLMPFVGQARLIQGVTDGMERAAWSSYLEDVARIRQWKGTA